MASAIGGGGAAAHDPVTTKITFAREIRAILQTRCARCHVPGGPAPMPLASYDDVRPWARALKQQVLTRSMPKWHAAHGYGAFSNDPSLTPVEMAAIASWVDGGMPRGTAYPPARTSRRPRVAGSALAIPASAAEATAHARPRWIRGWDFQPGDPLITAATFTSADGAPIGTWVAGDAPVLLPANAGLRVASPIHVRLERRAIADYEKPVTAKRSTLTLVPRTTPPTRRVWVERTSCGAPRTEPPAELLAVRPLLGDGASARIWLERPGAPRTIVGWFRGFDARYPRTYWLARSAELLPESRVQADTSCAIELTLARRERRDRGMPGP